LATADELESNRFTTELNLSSHETVALLLHIEDVDPHYFFLPNLQPVDVQVVLNVLKFFSATALVDPQ
jgi:hypothetical protein